MRGQTDVTTRLRVALAEAEAERDQLRGMLLTQRDETVAVLRAEVDRLRKGIAAVDQLIRESVGVAGLHLNGDIAYWTELRTGGGYEGWLLDFDAAIDAARGAELAKS